MAAAVTALVATIAVAIGVWALQADDEGGTTSETDRAPSVSVRSPDGVEITMALNRSEIGPGDHLAVDLTILNEGMEPAVWRSGPQPCRTPASVVLDLSEALDPGRVWVGNAGLAKQSAISGAEYPPDEVLLFSQPRRVCNLVLVRYETFPGHALRQEVEWNGELVAGVPAPSGSGELTATFEYDGREADSVSVTTPVEIVGPSADFLSPGQIVDAALSNAEVADWIDAIPVGGDVRLEAALRRGLEPGTWELWAGPAGPGFDIATDLIRVAVDERSGEVLEVAYGL
jgi:hypothetical protein